MSKSWHIVNVLKEKGPLTQLQLWSNLKGTPSFSSRSGMKDVLNILRHRSRVHAMPVHDTINNTKEHMYMVSAHKANYVSREESIIGLVKRKFAGREFKQFVNSVNKAEAVLREQYHATHPEEAGIYKQQQLFRIKHNKSGRLARQRLRKKNRAEREQKAEEREAKLIEAKASLKATQSGRTRLSLQDTPNKKRLALELNRLSGAKVRIAKMHSDLIKKGQIKADKAKERRSKIEAAGEAGTPERKAMAEKLRQIDEARAKKVSKWRKEKREYGRKKAALEAHAAPSSGDVNLDRVLSESISAAPADFLRDAAKKKLEKQRSEEKKGKSKTVQNKE